MDALNTRMVYLVEPLRWFASYGRVSQHRRCQVAQLCVSPSLISLRTYFMVADTFTKSRSVVSRPTAAFHSIVDAKLLNRASLHRKRVSLHHTHT